MYTAIATSSKSRESSDSFSLQDSLQKMPNQDAGNQSLGSSRSSIIDKTSLPTSADTMKLYKLYQQEYTIIAEYKMLQSENLHGVYVIPSFENSFLWFGVVFVRSGFYEGGVFRFTVTLPETFPDCECPTVTFQSQIFHPAIDASTGVLALHEVFPKWTKSSNHIWQILKYIHWTFQNINVKMPANPQALKQYKSNKSMFAEKAKESVMLSMDHLYDEPPTDDKHYISFSPYDPAVHEAALNSMLEGGWSEGGARGLSWVQPGAYQPFSKTNDNPR